MKITVEALAKAAPIIDKIKDLDLKIEQLDKLAEKAINGKVDFTHTIKFEKPKKKSRREREDFSPFGKPLQWGDMRMMLGGREIPGITSMTYRIDDVKEKELDLGFDISETCTLEILGCILGEYRRKRVALIDEIKRLNIPL